MTWLADLLPDATFIIVGIHVTNLSYLEDKSLCFIELLDNNTEESNRMLVGQNTAAIILEIYN